MLIPDVWVVKIKCMLTISRFNDGSRFVTGNRCERGEGKETSKSPLPDLYDYKFHRLFGYIPLSEETSTRGTIGIPKAARYQAANRRPLAACAFRCAR